MTSARIRAIRFFSRSTPIEFAEETGIKCNRLCLMEAGKITPSQPDIDSLLEQENILLLRGTTLEQINEREDLYSS